MKFTRIHHMRPISPVSDLPSRCAILKYSKPSHQNVASISISYIVHFEKNLNLFKYLTSFHIQI